MCTLAHVFEAAGLATIVLASTLEVAEKMRPPRALYCEFPLGRPLGKPSDPAFQRSVLDKALELVTASEPTLATYPETIEADETPMACAIPPRHDPNLPAAVDEANGLRAAYDRSVARRGFTSVGRVMGAEDVPTALGVLHRWAQGESYADVPLPATNTIAVCHDIRSYYLEAALELVGDTTPGSRSAEAWFFDTTEAGATMLAARAAIKEQGAPFPAWFYMVPGHR